MKLSYVDMKMKGCNRNICLLCFIKKQRRRISYIDNLLTDAGTEYVKDLQSIMTEREDNVYCQWSVREDDKSK